MNWRIGRSVDKDMYKRKTMIDGLDVYARKNERKKTGRKIALFYKNTYVLKTQVALRIKQKNE